MDLPEPRPQHNEHAADAAPNFRAMTNQEIGQYVAAREPEWENVPRKALDDDLIDHLFIPESALAIHAAGVTEAWLPREVDASARDLLAYVCEHIDMYAEAPQPEVIADDLGCEQKRQPSRGLPKLLDDLTARRQRIQFKQLVKQSARALKGDGSPTAAIAILRQGLPEIESLGDVNGNAFKWYTGREIQELVDEEPEWIAWPFVTLGSSTMLAGEWKLAGKTTLLATMCRHVILGRPFLNRPVLQMPVVYLYEGSAAEFKTATWPLAQLDDAAHDFHLLPHAENLGRAWPEVIREAIRKCQEVGSWLLIVDTKNAWASLTGEDDNSAAVARQAMAVIQEAQQLGIGVIIAAHPTKTGGTLTSMISGSGQWAAAASRIIGLWAFDRENYNDPRRYIEALGRQGIENNISRSAIEWDRDLATYLWLGDAPQVTQADKDDLLIKALRSIDRPATAQEVADETGEPFSSVKKRLRDATERGTIARSGSGNRHSPFLYSA
jgi:AAA domain